jgi:hypothetical protein
MLVCGRAQRNSETKTLHELYLAVIRLLDTSYSMSGAPISEMNEGSATLRQELLNDPMTSIRKNHAEEFPAHECKKFLVFVSLP